MPRRVLITGGAGLIGSTLTDLLLASAPDVRSITVLDDLSRGGVHNLSGAVSSPRFRLVEGDIRDAPLVDALVAECDVVFHMAAIRITRCVAEPRLANDILVNGTFNVVEAAARHGAKVVASSSASVYGMAETFPTPEAHHPWGNDTLYGAAKAYNEGLLTSFRAMHGLSYTALRYFNVYGPRMDTEGKYTEVMIRWMEAMAAGLPVTVDGDGSATMDFVHVSDIARANRLAMDLPDGGAVYNIGTGVETSLLELVRALGGAMGVVPEIEHRPARSVNSVPRRRADVGKAERELGFTASHDLRAGLRDLVEWWRPQWRARHELTAAVAGVDA